MTPAPDIAPAEMRDERWDEYVAAHEPGQVSVLLAFTFFITAVFQLGNWILLGEPAYGGTQGVLLPWCFWGVASVAQLVTAAQIRRSTDRRTPMMHWVVTVLQMIWVMTLAWFSAISLWAIFGTAILVAAISDARYFYDSLELRINYALSWLLFDLMLLAFDAVGLPGVLDRWETDHTFVVNAIIYQVLVLILQQVLLQATGRHWRALDEAFEARGRIETQLAVAERERSVIARTCSLLEPGLSAAQFSHDVSTPISTIGACTQELRELSNDLAEPDRETVQDVLEDLSAAQEELFLLTTSLVRSVRGEVAVPMSVAALVSDAVERARAKVHGAKHPILRVMDGSILAREHHTAVVSNLLANGMRERPDRAMEVTGQPLPGGWYLLTLRDHGVSPEERAGALARVHASLDLAPTDAQAAAQAGRPVQGYGLALVLAKVHLVRHGGWLAARSPADGDGLVFDLMLPGPTTDDRDALDVLRDHQDPRTPSRPGLLLSR